MSKYLNIQNLVPAGEHFDESAIVNEGGYLSVHHLNAIEKSLSENGSAVSALQGQLDAVNDTVNEKDGIIATMTASAETATGNIQKKDEQIAALNTTIATQAADLISLGKKSSGTGSTVIADANTEVVVEKNESVGLNSDNHPLNILADTKRGYRDDMPKK